MTTTLSVTSSVPPSKTEPLFTSPPSHYDDPDGETKRFFEELPPFEDLSILLMALEALPQWSETDPNAPFIQSVEMADGSPTIEVVMESENPSATPHIIITLSLDVQSSYDNATPSPQDAADGLYLIHPDPQIPVINVPCEFDEVYFDTPPTPAYSIPTAFVNDSPSPMWSPTMTSNEQWLLDDDDDELPDVSEWSRSS